MCIVNWNIFVLRGSARNGASTISFAGFLVGSDAVVGDGRGRAKGTLVDELCFGS